MVKENMSKVQKLTVSTAVMALTLLCCTLRRAFGAYQIRIGDGSVCARHRFRPGFAAWFR